MSAWRATRLRTVARIRSEAASAPATIVGPSAAQSPFGGRLSDGPYRHPWATS
jgi:hypothetical protein